jgi:hypothetical protein
MNQQKEPVCPEMPIANALSSLIQIQKIGITLQLSHIEFQLPYGLEKICTSKRSFPHDVLVDSINTPGNVL